MTVEQARKRIVDMLPKNGAVGATVEDVRLVASAILDVIALIEATDVRGATKGGSMKLNGKDLDSGIAASKAALEVMQDILGRDGIGDDFRACETAVIMDMFENWSRIIARGMKERQ